MADKNYGLNMDDVRKWAKRDLDAAKDDRENFKKNTNFIAGDQWPSDILEDRKERPCLTINDLPTYLFRLVGDQRQRQISIKSRPVDDFADPKIAEIMDGMIRNIEYVSIAKTAINWAFQNQVGGSYGFYRIKQRYVSPDSFDQELIIEGIENPLSVTWDSARTGLFWDNCKRIFIFDELHIDDFKKQYPGKSVTSVDDIESEEDLRKDWFKSETVKVAELYKMDEVKKPLYKIQEEGQDPVDVRTRDLNKYGKEIFDVITKAEKFPINVEYEVDEFNEQYGIEIPVTRVLKVLKKRMSKESKITHYKLYGEGVLEPPEVLPIPFYPIIPVWGRQMLKDNKKILCGMFDHSQDAVRNYNYWASAATETVALQPKAPYMATPEQVKGYESDYRNIGNENKSLLLYNPDPQAITTKPDRQAPPQLSLGMVERLQTSKIEKHDTIGIQPVSMGKKSNEISGKAIMAKQQESEVGNFDFSDNLATARIYEGKVLISWIPFIYDTQRMARIRGEDGKESAVPINAGKDMFGEDYEGAMVLDKEKQIYNRLDIGKYDVYAEPGPAYATQRQETADRLVTIMERAPQYAELISDLLFNSLDFKGADEAARRLEAFIKAKHPELFEEEGQPKQPSKEEMIGAVMQQVKMQQEGEKLENTQLKNDKLRQELGMMMDEKMVDWTIKIQKILEGVGGSETQ